MARERTQRVIEETLAIVEPVTETVTYIPGEGDPSSVKWCGLVFQANMPKEVSGHAEGNDREKLHAGLIEAAKTNPSFKVGAGQPRGPRPVSSLPETAEQYRAYVVGWLKDARLDHADLLIARWARDHELREACEVGSDDYAYLATLFMPRLHDLAKADELTEGQLAGLWLGHGINQLPW